MNVLALLLQMLLQPFTPANTHGRLLVVMNAFANCKYFRCDWCLLLGPWKNLETEIFIDLCRCKPNLKKQKK